MYIIDKTLFISNKEYMDNINIDTVIHHLNQGKINRIIFKGFGNKENLIPYRLAHIYNKDYSLYTEFGGKLLRFVEFDNNSSSDKNAITYFNIKGYYSVIYKN